MKMGKIEKSLILDSYIRRRKSNQNTEVYEKQKKREALRRLSVILRKCESLRTPEEVHLLETGGDIVKQILRRQDRVKRSKERVLEKEDAFETIDKKAEKLADVLSRARHLVCYTGAGISTSARIPDYRGSQGIWTLLQKGQDIGQHDLSLADPTFTHMALYELHRRNILRYVLSQNCDGLHLRSGLPRKSLSEVHGNMYIEVCKHCKPNVEYWRLFDTTELTARYYHKTNRRCHFCGKPLIDTIVHFGERGSLKWPLNWDGACRHAEKADVILCLGSSLKVLKKYSWLWAMDRSKQKRPKIYIVNLQWTPKDAVANMKINGKCDEVMRLVMKYMNIDVPKYSRANDPIFAHANLLAPEEMHTVSQPMLKKYTNDYSDTEDGKVLDELEEDDTECKKLKKELPDLIPINNIGLIKQEVPETSEISIEDTAKLLERSNIANESSNNDKSKYITVNNHLNVTKNEPPNLKQESTNQPAAINDDTHISNELPQTLSRLDLKCQTEETSTVNLSDIDNMGSNQHSNNIKQQSDNTFNNIKANNCLEKSIFPAQQQSFCDKSRHISKHLIMPAKITIHRHPRIVIGDSRIGRTKGLTTNRTLTNSNDAFNSINNDEKSMIKCDIETVENDNTFFRDKDEFKTILSYYKAIENQLPHWYDVNYAYSGLHSIIHPPPNEVDIWGTHIIPIFQLNRKEADCEFCFDHYAEYNCQFYHYRKPEFHAMKRQRNGKLIVCECCTDNEVDIDESEDMANKIRWEQQHQLDDGVPATDDENDKCAKLNVVVKEAETAATNNKVQPGWYGKGYRKAIRRKRKPKLAPLVTI